MDRRKRARLLADGWKIGDAAEFLSLGPEEAALVELRLILSDELRAGRKRTGMTQTELAEKIGSSQSRVAKMEACDPSVSIDLLLRGLFATGASRKEVAEALARRG